MRAPPSDYERKAHKQIHEWKNPELGWFGQSMEVIGWPRDSLGTVVKSAGDTVGLGHVVNGALAGTVEVLGDAAAWTVRPEAVYERFRKAGRGIQQRIDILELDLEHVDAVVGWLDTKYKGLACAEGAAAGAAGIPGLIVDVPALIALNMRAIAEFATYYGFDVASQRERLFAMHVLGLASSPSARAKMRVMAQLARIAVDASKKKAWKDIEKAVLARVIRQIAKALGIRLTKAKLAQAVPIMGAAVGGGFNAYYTARVCDSAFHLYRERFLAEKYGAAIIDVTAKPAEGEGFEPNYPEAYEEIPGIGP